MHRGNAALALGEAAATDETVARIWKSYEVDRPPRAYPDSQPEGPR